MRNTNSTMRNWILGTAAAAVLLATGAVSAHAAPQEFRGRGDQSGGRHFEGRTEGRAFDRGYGRGFERNDARGFYRPGGNFFVENYVPPCPGDGYIWTAGYYNDGYWVPGVWTLRSGYGFNRGFGFVGGYGYDRGRDNHFDRRLAENRSFENRNLENQGGRAQERGFGGENHGRR